LKQNHPALERHREARNEQNQGRKEIGIPDLRGSSLV
jgi:hypothetical protein